MMMGAGKAVFAILVGYLALVGLVQVCVAVARWFCAAGRMVGCWLIVAAGPQDRDIEARLRQAHSQLVLAPALTGVRLVVVDAGADGETEKICRCFCREKNVPMVRPGDLSALLRGGAAPAGPLCADEER